MLSENSLDIIQDFLPLVAANAFNVAILIIPTCVGMPMMPVIPDVVFVNEVIYMLYDTTNSVFSALVKKNDPVTSSSSCKCGTRLKKVQQHAQPRCINPFLCTCRKNNQSCSSKCCCQGCGNNKEKTPLKMSRRKRTTPILSLMPNETSLGHLISIDQEPLASSISGLHHYIMESCLFQVLKEMQADFVSLTDDLILEKLHEKYGILNSNLRGADINSLNDINSQTLRAWIKWRKRKGEYLSQRKDSL